MRQKKEPRTEKLVKDIWMGRMSRVKVLTKQTIVPWRQVVIGERVGTAHRKKEMVKVERPPNFIDIFLSLSIYY